MPLRGRFCIHFEVGSLFLFLICVNPRSSAADFSCLCVSVANSLLFRKTTEKLQDKIARCSLIDARVSWLKKLTHRLNSANSRSRPSPEQSNLVEQSEWARKSTRSVEVMVETDDVIFCRRTDNRENETHEKRRRKSYDSKKF